MARRRDRIEELRKAVSVTKAREKSVTASNSPSLKPNKKRMKNNKPGPAESPADARRKPPSEVPQSGDHNNFTDEESRIRKTSSGYEQSYNA